MDRISTSTRSRSAATSSISGITANDGHAKLCARSSSWFDASKVCWWVMDGRWKADG